jgi:hypothetical protein
MDLILFFLEQTIFGVLFEIGIYTVREMCGNSHESVEILKRCLSQVVGQHYTLQMANHFALHHEHLFTHL